MKLLSVRLVNYIGIANGTGKHELYIDFTACKSIIAVVGHNGSGKSTLLKSLHPFPDSYDVLIPNCEGSKELKYLKDNHMYDIKIHYIHTDSKNSTEVAIFKDGVNLNPNLNVTNAKDILMNEFELDSNYITLSQLSSEDRGLADKRPSERKKFVNDILADLTVYNTMYKTLNKKSSNFKNLINNLSYKINNLGGDNLPLLESNIEQLNKRLEKLEKDKDSLIAEQTTINNAMDLNNGVKHECLMIKQQYDATLSQHTDIIDKINFAKSQTPREISIADADPKDLSMLADALLKNYTTEYIKTKTELETKTKELNKISSKYQNALSERNIKINQLSSLKGIDINIDTFLDTLNTLEKRKTQLEKQLPTQLRKSKNSSLTINKVYQELSDINGDLYKVLYYLSEDDIKKNGTDKQIEETSNQLSLLLNNNENRYNQLKSNKTTLIDLDHIEDIPDTCKNGKCYFYQTKMKYLAMKDEIDKQNKEIEQLKVDIDKTVKQISLSKDYLREYKTIEQYLKFLNRNQDIINEISSLIKVNRHKLFLKDSESLVNAFSNVLDNYNLLDNYKAVELEYSNMAAQYLTMSNSINSIKKLETEISNLDKEISELVTEQEQLSSQVTTWETTQNNLQIEIDCINQLLDLGKQFDQIQTVLLQCKSEYDKHESTIKQMVILEEKLNNISEQIKSTSLEIQTVKQELDNTKYNARLLKEYKREYDTYITDYEKIETIKRFTSPTTGIQTLFMETYMNNVLIIANQLLALMFNGEFVLQPFIINESEFRIPCAGSGYLNDDISSMSTSQICMISMIISFAMLYNSSSCYNIIKLDEIDSGLDNDNRFRFVEMLNQIMSIMNCEQCFIISHNMELDESQISKIDMNSI